MNLRVLFFLIVSCMFREFSFSVFHICSLSICLLVYFCPRHAPSHDLYSATLSPYFPLLSRHPHLHLPYLPLSSLPLLLCLTLHCCSSHPLPWFSRTLGRDVKLAVPSNFPQCMQRWQSRCICVFHFSLLCIPFFTLFRLLRLSICLLV